MSAFAYRADLDGLRAVAVAMVLLFHAGLACSGGYVGVDIFFVLSGYLITGIIARDLSAGTFSLAEFWNRRIRRILPAATVMVSASLLAGACLLLPADVQELGRSTLWQQLMLSNVYCWRHTGYFDESAESSLLLHTWSLAVEEQFYLGYPWLLWAAWRWCGRRVGALLLTLAVASFVLCAWAMPEHPVLAFFLLPTRMWELLIGGCLALVPDRVWRAWQHRGHATGLGLMLLLSAAVCLDQNTPFPGYYALWPCLGTLLVIAGGTFSPASLVGSHTSSPFAAASWTTRVLSWAPLVYLGQISYSLYLWHWLPLALLRYWYGLEIPWMLRIMALLATGVIALGSYYLIETPCRRGAKTAKLPQVLCGAGLATALLLMAGYALQQGAGFPGRFSSAALAHAGQLAPLKEYAADRHQFDDSAITWLGDTTSSSAAPDFLLWGDSHAVMLAQLCDDLATQHRLRGAMIARFATPPVLGVRVNSPSQGGASIAWNQAALEYAVRSPAQAIILVGRWGTYLNGDLTGRTDLLLRREQHETPTRDTATDLACQQLDQTLQILLNAGKQVYLLKQFPEQKLNARRAMVLAESWGSPLPRGVTRNVYRGHQARASWALEKACRGKQGIRLLDPASTCFDTAQVSRVASAEGPYYSDYQHLTRLGAEHLARPLLEPIFVQLSGPRAEGDQRAHH